MQIIASIDPKVAANPAGEANSISGSEVLAGATSLSVEDIENSIENLLEDTALRDQLARDGLKAAAGFSWETCARETLDLFMRAHEGVNGKPLRELSAE